MTLESRVNKNRYIGNGATTQFPFTFKVWKANQILVFTGDGKTEQEVSAQCAITLTKSGGTVEFQTAPASGVVIVIRRNMPYIQEDDYRNGTRFDSEEIEDRLDQDCAERQDLLLGVSRCLQIPETSEASGEQIIADIMQARQDVVDSMAAAGDVTGATLVTAYGTTEPREIARRLADIVNVKDFGAKGDGESDDAEAINAAINAGAGKAVWFPAGTYLTSTGIRIPSNTAIFGSGEATTTIRLTNPYSCTDCITNDKNWWNDHDYGVLHGFYSTATQQANTGNENIYLGYMTVDGNGSRDNYVAVAGAPVGSAVHFANVKNTVLEHVTGINGRLHCIDVSSSMYSEAHDSEAETVYRDEYDVLWGNWYIGESKNVRLIHCSGIDPVLDDPITTHYSGFIDIFSPKCFCSEYSESRTTTNGLEIDDGSYNVNVYGGYSANCCAGLQIKGHTKSFPAHNVFVHGYSCENNKYNFMVSHDTPDNPLYAESAANVVLKDCVSTTPKSDGNDLWMLSYSRCKVENFHCVGDGETQKTATSILLTISLTNSVFSGIYFDNIVYGDFGLILVNSSAGAGLRFERVFASNCFGSYIIQDARTDTSININGLYGYAPVNTTNKALLYAGLGSLIASFTSIENVSGSGYICDIKDNHNTTFNATELRKCAIVGDENTIFKRAVTNSLVSPFPSYVQSYGVYEDYQTVQVGETLLIGFEHKNSSVGSAPEKIGFIGAKKHGSGISWGLVFGTNHDGSGGLSEKWEIVSNGPLRPCADNAYNVGTPSLRIAQLCAGTATINTSDEREKDNVEEPVDALMRAWGRVSFKVFQFKDAIEKKGALARLHVGVVAQQVRDAFAEEGLDAGRYGLFCHDEWQDEFEDVVVEDKPQVLDENGTVIEEAVTHTERRKIQNAGDRYGIRYEEALALECAYQRWRLEQLEERINQITSNS